MSSTAYSPRPTSEARAGGRASSGTSSVDAVQALEQALDARRSQKRKRALLLVAALVGGVVGYSWYTAEDVGPVKSPYVATEVELRDIVETVESTGKLRPLKEVQVGTQVSGRIVAVHVDFNSEVHEGQLLAEVDPSLFGAQVHQVSGQLNAAKAQLERARAAHSAAALTLERTQQLRSEDIASQAELDQARIALELAEADIAAQRAQIRGLSAQLKSANTTLGYTKIYSPIDGIVINRAVDPGQTVASSFSAPILFVIAQDLTRMQVLADIDEADVGKLEEGMDGKVSVDAFPGEVFEGKVTQVRYSPTEVQGVVTYAAVVDVPNPKRKLRPGMTATVAIATRRAEGAVAVPNAALRFKPSEGAAASGQPLEVGQRRVYFPPKAPSRVADEGQGKTDAVAAEERRLKLESEVVTLGVSDGIWTALVDSSLKPGDEVITQEKATEDGRRRKFLGIF